LGWLTGKTGVVLPVSGLIVVLARVSIKALSKKRRSVLETSGVFASPYFR